MYNRRTGGNPLSAKSVESSNTRSVNSVSDKSGIALLKAMDSHSFEPGVVARIVTSASPAHIHRKVWGLVTAIVIRYAYLAESGAHNTDEHSYILHEALAVRDFLATLNPDD